ncbi:putative cuticle protein, partial [Operophtera brumata]
MMPSTHWAGSTGMTSRKEQGDKSRELRQRQQWLVNFSAQSKRWAGASGMTSWKEQGDKSRELRQRQQWLVNFREPKPTRTNPGRLPRFMVAISDRIAVWIENAVYRADAIEPSEVGSHEHMRLDVEKPL